MRLASAKISPAKSAPPWGDLPPDLLGLVIAHLPFPADRARLRAVCRAWHAAAREHARRQQLPWIVLPDGSFCTVGDDGVFFPRIPGLPEDATCLGAAGGRGGWLALDRTGAARRRTSLRDRIQSADPWEPPRDVRHAHAYLLHNPFSGATVALPEMDSVAGDVSEAFQIRKVLMRSSSPDDVVAVTTNCCACSVILLRRGKGVSVPPYYLRVFDVAFLGDRLYGITLEEDLLAFDLAEDSNGAPSVVNFKRVIRHPLADGEVDLLSWMDVHSNDDESDDDDDNDGDLSSSNGEEEEEESGDDEAPNQTEVDDDDDDQDNNDEEEEEESGDGWPNRIEESFNTYGNVPNGSVMVEDENSKAMSDDDDEPKDQITTTRYLVASSSGKELLMARHHAQTPPSSDSYTRGVELFRADLDSGRWVPVTGGGLAGEALFLGGSFSKSTSAYGGVEEGLVYFAAGVEDVFDTRSWSPRTFTMPWQRHLACAEFLTWLFPPELVV